MDEWLANVYGTGQQQAPEVDLEKVAQLAVLEKLAEEGQVDLSQLTEEEAMQLANEVIEAAANEDGAPQQEPQQEQVEEELAKEAQAKFEEADFLGRVMAHSYTQELEKIAMHQPVHGDPGDPTTGHYRPKLDMNVARSKWGHRFHRAKEKLIQHARTAGKHISKHRAPYAIGGTALAAGAAGALAAHKSNKSTGKTKTAFEKLAEDRALEILQANGIDPSQQQQQQPNPDAQFEDAVNARASELLEQAGYSFQEPQQ